MTVFLKLSLIEIIYVFHDFMLSILLQCVLVRKLCFWKSQDKHFKYLCQWAFNSISCEIIMAYKYMKGWRLLLKKYSNFICGNICYVFLSGFWSTGRLFFRTYHSIQQDKMHKKLTNSSWSSSSPQWQSIVWSHYVNQ